MSYGSKNDTWNFSQIPDAWSTCSNDDFKDWYKTTGHQCLRNDPCPDAHNPSTNVCPKANVRVLRVKPQKERKFCYYQKCNAFSTDLSSIALGQAGLGTGGYCIPRAQLYVQYEYCCELESYFTYPPPTLDKNGNLMERDPEDIKFPRCKVMIPHPIP